MEKWNNLSNKDKSPFPRIDEFFMELFDYLTEMLFYAQRDVEKEVKKYNEEQRQALGIQITNAQLFSGPHGEWEHENTLKVYEDKKNVFFLFHLLDFFAALEKQPGGIQAFFERLLTAEPEPEFPDKVNIFCDPKTTVNLFGEIIAPEKSPALYYRLLFYGICKRLLKYGSADRQHELSDFIRVFWGWIRGIRQRVHEDLSVRDDLRVEDLWYADHICDALLGDADVFTALDTAANNCTAPKRFKAPLEAENVKAAWRQKGKYEAVKLLSQLADLRGDLHHLYPALDALSSGECVSRFRDFCGKDADERIRILCAHGFNGIATWDDNYRYYGYDKHWELVFTAVDPKLTDVLTDMLLRKPDAPASKEEMRWYMIRYQAFRTSSPVNFFYVEAPFTIWTRRNGKIRRMGYAHCPYAYTVVQLLDEADRTLLGATDWSYYSEHGRLWLESVGLSLECVEKGWNIECTDGRHLKKQIAQRFAIGEDAVEDTEDVYKFEKTVLQDLPGADRIETARAFVKELADLIRK